jgi:KaiC/GvpD/RAD55 family RecA-like ATPase
MTNPFMKAEKCQAKLRLAIDGPSGSGKTYTALIAATVLADGGKIAVIDTERASAALYADTFEFDTATLDQFNPKHYIDLIEAAEEAGYAVIVIDSLSHAWEGEGGALDMVDAAARRIQGNSYAAWKDVTPLHRRLVDAMLQSKAHIIATMRSKMDYVQEKDERTGKTVIRKVGMAPIQRQGMEYEFTIVADMDIDHNLVVTKSRMSGIADAVVNRPDRKFFAKVLDWLKSGAAAPELVKPEPKPEFRPAVPTMTLEQAYAMKTPKGMLLSDASRDQLEFIIANAKNGLREAAGMILAHLAEQDAASQSN